ncbi:MAG TPA: cbb3-type cytochrome oxidase assembly protein CcoS [Verrucomicrobiae bacterium]|jgi:cbb3-type cytochrome oxidase maturation protein
MSVIFLLIPLSIIAATGFLLAFVWAVRSGQYEDTATPSMRVLLDEPGKPVKKNDLATKPEKTEHEPGNV